MIRTNLKKCSGKILNHLGIDLVSMEGNMIENLGERLVNLRRQNQLSQEGLAGKIGVSRQAISKWERGEGLPDLHNMSRLSSLYGLSIDEILNGSTSKDSSGTTISLKKNEEVSIAKDNGYQNNFKIDSSNLKDEIPRERDIHVDSSEGSIHNTLVMIGLMKAIGICMIISSSFAFVAFNNSFLAMGGLLSLGVGMVVFSSDLNRKYKKYGLKKKMNHKKNLKFSSNNKNISSVFVVIAGIVLFGVVLKAWSKIWVLLLVIPLYTIYCKYSRDMSR